MFQEIKRNEEINTYITSADAYLERIGYTEHGFKHVSRCVAVVEYILKSLDYDEHTIDIAKIAAYMHDIGNIVNRDGHAKFGAIMAYNILTKLNMDPKDIAKIVSAIGNHDESSAYPVSEISSALIIADKNIHNRVNYAAIQSKVEIDKDKKTLTLNLTIDQNICPIIEYFEIFLSRMMLTKKAAAYFNLEFKLLINNQTLL